MADEEVGVTSLSLLALTLATNEGERLPVTPHTYEAEAIGMTGLCLIPILSLHCTSKETSKGYFTALMRRV
jgi:hypothetical protein